MIKFVTLQSYKCTHTKASVGYDEEHISNQYIFKGPMPERFRNSLTYNVINLITTQLIRLLYGLELCCIRILRKFGLKTVFCLRVLKV